MMRRPCETCGQPETFILNRYSNSTATYVAMETGPPLNDATISARLGKFIDDNTTPP